MDIELICKFVVQQRGFVSAFKTYGLLQKHAKPYLVCRTVKTNILSDITHSQTMPYTHVFTS